MGACITPWDISKIEDTTISLPKPAPMTLPAAFGYEHGLPDARNRSG
jgi:hypothetical protein